MTAAGAAAALALLALAACSGDGPPGLSGAAKCMQPAPPAVAVSCSMIFGGVVNALGQPMDGVEGTVRVPERCGCTSPRVTVDERGIFSVTIHRLQGAPAAATPDTVTGTVVLFATDPKYPKHHTGGFYFDTARVVMRFAAIGAAPVPIETHLRIPLPDNGS